MMTSARSAEYTTPRRVKCPTAPPTPSVDTPASPIDHHITLPLDVTIQGTNGKNAPTEKKMNDEIAATHGIARGRRVDAELFASVRAQRQVGVLHQVDGEAIGQLLVDTPSEKQGLEFQALVFGIVGERSPLYADLVLVELFLRTHREVLARSHGKGSRDESRQARETHDVVSRIRAREAQDERDVGYQTIEEAEQRGAESAAADLSMMGFDERGPHARSLPVRLGVTSLVRA